MSQNYPEKMSSIPAMAGHVKHLYTFYGLRRTGNHALLYWLFGQFEPVSWYSDANRVPLEVLKPTYYLKGRGRIGKEFERGMLNFEEFSVADLTTVVDSLPKVVRGGWDFCQCILTLRDPFNWVASRLNWSVRGSATPLEERQAAWFVCNDKTMELWKAYARAYLAGRIGGFPIIPVNYNEWFLSEKYRKGLALNLRLEFSDRMLEYVGREGAGSSFDSYEYQNHAQQMRVIDRYKKFANPANPNHDFFMALFDDEIRELSRQIFGFCPI